MRQGSRDDAEKSLKRQPSFKWGQFVKPAKSPTQFGDMNGAMDSPKASPRTLEHDIPVRTMVVTLLSRFDGGDSPCRCLHSTAYHDNVLWLAFDPIIVACSECIPAIVILPDILSDLGMMHDGYLLHIILTDEDAPL